MSRITLAISVALFVGLLQPASAALISVGTFPVTNPLPSITIPSGDFLVPIDVTGAAGLQTWQFDLNYDASVVEEVDPGDGSSGIYGAQFTPGDPTTNSFILAGFPLPGVVSGISGEYPDLLNGVTGDGVLAYVLFQFLPGQENKNPDFMIANAQVLEPVPEPSSLAVFGLGLLLMTIRRKLRRRGGTNA